MGRVAWLVGIVVFLGLGAPVDVSGQDPEAADLINLFFDCQAPGCHDLDFFRREAPFVNWVRDREVADVHVLVTSQSTGGGGRQYTLAFIGLGDFEGTDHELSHSTPGDATTDEQRGGIVERVKLGLVTYAQTTSAADRLRVVFAEDPRGPRQLGRPGPGGSPGADAGDDPWDFWVFRISANGFLNGQATSRFSNTFANVSANRTTEAWKVSVSGNFSHNVQSFDLSDGSTVEEIRRDWGTNLSLVRSVGAQWALGLRGDLGSSTFVNQNLRWSLKPGVEYNFFPYSESSRRSLTLQYLVGPNYFEYTERTIFDEKFETVPQHVLAAELSLVEPWGRWSTSVTGQQYLHDTSKYNVTISGNFNIRLFQGFSIRMGGNYSWIRDQLFISAAGATDEQILLRQRQLGTSYRYFTSFGIEYRFGSIFNNVVNPRFGGNAGGGEMIFF